MGTGAVYVVLSGLKNRSPAVAAIETAFYFLNMVLFFLNTTTLVLQAIRTFWPLFFAWRILMHSGQFTPVRPIEFWRILSKAFSSLWLYVLGFYLHAIVILSYWRCSLSLRLSLGPSIMLSPVILDQTLSTRCSGVWYKERVLGGMLKVQTI